MKILAILPIYTLDDVIGDSPACNAITIGNGRTHLPAIIPSTYR